MCVNTRVTRQCKVIFAAQKYMFWIQCDSCIQDIPNQGKQRESVISKDSYSINKLKITLKSVILYIWVNITFCSKPNCRKQLQMQYNTISRNSDSRYTASGRCWPSSFLIPHIVHSQPSHACAHTGRLFLTCWIFKDKSWSGSGSESQRPKMRGKVTELVLLWYTCNWDKPGMSLSSHPEFHKESTFQIMHLYTLSHYCPTRESLGHQKTYQ